MKLIHTTAATATQKKEMEDLIAACKAQEPLLLSAPVQDDLGYDIFLLYGDDHCLDAMSFLFFPEESPCECCTFVHPEKRRRGLFTRLLNETIDLLEEHEKKLGAPIDFCFLADEKTPSAMAVLQAIGAEYWYSEHKMERPLTKKDRLFSMPSLTIHREEDYLYCAKLKDKVIGTCAILPSDENIYLYAFQIHEDFQGQGYGKEFLLGMLSLLADMGSLVTLQVSGQNYIARNLYKKTGFRTVESLSYYLY